jgi:hypothetical protein
MELLAIAGTAMNLYLIWRIRSLRSRPSSQWRVEPVAPVKKRAEAIQIALAILTLLLVWLSGQHTSICFTRSNHLSLGPVFSGCRSSPRPALRGDVR